MYILSDEQAYRGYKLIYYNYFNPFSKDNLFQKYNNI